MGVFEFFGGVKSKIKVLFCDGMCVWGWGLGEVGKKVEMSII